MQGGTGGRVGFACELGIDLNGVLVKCCRVMGLGSRHHGTYRIDWADWGEWVHGWG